jgi:class 3 adenylate cyclase
MCDDDEVPLEGMIAIEQVDLWSELKRQARVGIATGLVVVGSDWRGGFDYLPSDWSAGMAE